MPVSKPVWAVTNGNKILQLHGDSVKAGTGVDLSTKRGMGAVGSAVRTLVNGLKEARTVVVPVFAVFEKVTVTGMIADSIALGSASSTSYTAEAVLALMSELTSVRKPNPRSPLRTPGFIKFGLPPSRVTKAGKERETPAPKFSNRSWMRDPPSASPAMPVCDGL